MSMPDRLQAVSRRGASARGRGLIRPPSVNQGDSERRTVGTPAFQPSCSGLTRREALIYGQALK